MGVHRVIAADKDTGSLPTDESLKKININIFDVENPYDFFEKPDIILHLAWRDGFVHYSNAHIIDLPKHYEFIKRICESDAESIAVMGSMHEIGKSSLAGTCRDL